MGGAAGPGAGGERWGCARGGNGGGVRLSGGIGAVTADGKRTLRTRRLIRGRCTRSFRGSNRCTGGSNRARHLRLRRAHFCRGAGDPADFFVACDFIAADQRRRHHRFRRKRRRPRRGSRFCIHSNCRSCDRAAGERRQPDQLPREVAIIDAPLLVGSYLRIVCPKLGLSASLMFRRILRLEHPRLRPRQRLALGGVDEPLQLRDHLVATASSARRTSSARSPRPSAAGSSACSPAAPSPAASPPPAAPGSAAASG